MRTVSAIATHSSSAVTAGQRNRADSSAQSTRTGASSAAAGRNDSKSRSNAADAGSGRRAAARVEPSTADAAAKVRTNGSRWSRTQRLQGKLDRFQNARQREGEQTAALEDAEKSADSLVKRLEAASTIAAEGSEETTESKNDRQVQRLEARVEKLRSENEDGKSDARIARLEAKLAKLTKSKEKSEPGAVEETPAAPAEPEAAETEQPVVPADETQPVAADDETEPVAADEVDQSAAEESEPVAVDAAAVDSESASDDVDDTSDVVEATKDDSTEKTSSGKALGHYKTDSTEETVATKETASAEDSEALVADLTEQLEGLSEKLESLSQEPAETEVRVDRLNNLTERFDRLMDKIFSASASASSQSRNLLGFQSLNQINSALRVARVSKSLLAGVRETSLRGNITSSLQNVSKSLLSTALRVQRASLNAASRWSGQTNSLSSSLSSYSSWTTGSSLSLRG